MIKAYLWIRNPHHFFCFFAALIGSCLPANADFIPDKGVIVQHWKEPQAEGNFSRYFWLNDHEVIYVKSNISPVEQYNKIDLTTKKEQNLLDFTKIVLKTLGSWQLPKIFPSPNRKYLAWIERHEHDEDTLNVATMDGSIVSRKPSKTHIQYPSWSEDSQWCFAFVEGHAPDDIFPGESRRIFKMITEVNIKTPSVVNTYPIALKPQMQLNALSGNNYFFSSNPSEAPPLLPAFHFGSKKNILVVSSKTGELSEDIQFDEYNIVDTTKPMQSHTMHLPIPAPWEMEYAVISPLGDAIVWKFQQKADAEFWISDQYGGNLKRIGKLHPNSKYQSISRADMQWFPNGKGISFLDEGELCVVYLDTRKTTE